MGKEVRRITVSCELSKHNDERDIRDEMAFETLRISISRICQMAPFDCLAPLVD